MPSNPTQAAPRSPKPAGGAMAGAMKQTKARKRKGSLRKTALLGTGRLRTELTTKNEAKWDQNNGTESESSSEPQASDGLPTPIALPKVQPPVPWVSHPVHGILHKALIEHTPAGKLHKSPPVSSTTDEDEVVKPNISPNSQVLPPSGKTPFSSASSTSDSYFPPQLGILPRRIRHSPKSPLSTVAAEALPSPEEWDYTETQWWGWVVLIVTWIVFVVGMGSCLGVWSWAWDVGETPSAPPELEDDPTLPIVGYYPALIILTGVVAWVWVTVAWVGMKYFKHAKMGGDDEG
ncbi:MAG: hypothetical protein LQ348_002288 [Seirophora lacunosa]|nr:MAG: hypothetical protein LQ344_007031 [Seirophora lacunosa]KAI4196542.1 MAG: hypothetical protein LQ348_002288 [Seirophora lacunosa]